MAGDFKCSICEHIGIIRQRNGWTRELNLVAWGENNPKLDIRDWNEDHTKMSKGITLSNNEAEALLALLEGRFRK